MHAAVVGSAGRLGFRYMRWWLDLLGGLASDACGGPQARFGIQLRHRLLKGWECAISQSRGIANMVATPMSCKIMMHSQGSLEGQEAEAVLGLEGDVVVRQAWCIGGGAGLGLVQLHEGCHLLQHNCTTIHCYGLHTQAAAMP